MSSCGEFVHRWLAEYDAGTPWEIDVMEIAQGELTFLFDGAPTLRAAGGDHGEDRVVAVWGPSRVPNRHRDRGWANAVPMKDLRESRATSQPDAPPL